MMMKLKEVREAHSFEPKYSYYQLENYFEKQLYNDKLYDLVRKLASMAYPTEENANEKKWFNFYVPLKRSGYFIVIPLSIVLYKERFFLFFHHFNKTTEVYKGKSRVKDFYIDLMKQTIEFSRVIKKEPNIVKKSLPYDIRTGKILGKYVLDDLLSSRKKKEILKLYEKHIKNVRKIFEISLEDYLNTAVICYKAAFGEKAKNLTPMEMYRKWADGRDCGMLEIKDKKSKGEFENWLKNKAHCGGHPFEIVFSWHRHGIHLYPPIESKPYFTLSVTNYAYAKLFLKMVLALIKNKISFEAYELKNVLNYLAGKTYFTVNDYSEHFIHYIPSKESKRELFKYIEWDEPKIVKWK